MNATRIMRSLTEEPGKQIELKFPPVTVGCLLRRQFRVLLAAAEMDGLEVVWREEKGLIDSVFLIRMTGRGRLLARHLQRMMAL